MTALHLAEDGEAADLAAYLSRLLHYDRSAAVRLQAAGTALAVFGRPPSFDVLAIRAVRLAKPYEDGLASTLDVTVSAGELLEYVNESAATVAVPASVTGPPWAGVLPPRGGWRTEQGLPAPESLRAVVAMAVGEFKSRTGELAPDMRSRAELDRIGRDIWSRTVGGTGLPVRAVHAAQSLGFLRPTAPATETVTETATETATDASAVTGDGVPKLLSSGTWLRLRTPYGSVAVRRAGTGLLGVSVR